MRPMDDFSASLDRMRVGLGGIASNSGSNRLAPMEAFGPNPGALRALLHLPSALPRGAPLVVVLHGCTQTAHSYDAGSGWSELAERFGFAVLFPEQQRANNPNLCFNWFSPVDTRRGGGEAESIQAMVLAAIDRHHLDPARVFVTGLSAGGAMTAAMLASYPELFAGGAIIAGLPYGAASGVPQALERMRGQGHDRATLSKRITDASPRPRAWPTVSIWHGTADPTVDAMNAAMLVEQWCGVHGVGKPDVVDQVNGQVHRAWHDREGRLVLEEFAIAGFGHGTPLATSGDEACGRPGPHMLDAGISSTYRIAASWGIVPATAPARQAADVTRHHAATFSASPAPEGFDPGLAINKALRAAGLMKP